MRIKRFEARTMTEALRMVKKEFGPNAVILSARNLKREESRFEPTGPAGVEVTAATDNYLPQPRGPKQPVPPTEARPDQAEPDAAAGMDETSGKAGLVDFLQKTLKAAMRRPPSATETGEDRQLSPQVSETLLRATDDLIAAGVHQTVAVELMQAVRQKLPPRETPDEQGMRRLLAQVLISRQNFRNPLRTGLRTVCLLGSTGVGKTTTLGKLAAIQAIQGHRRVALISVSPERIGAEVQFETIARILQLPHAIVNQRKDLRRQLINFQNADLVLIDTPGISPLRRDEITILKDMLSGQPIQEFWLVLSACTHAADMNQAIQSFGGIGVHRLIFSKIDEVNSYGVLLNQMVRHKIPIAYWTEGYHIPEGLHPASAVALVDLVLSANGAKGRITFELPEPEPGGETPPPPAAQKRYLVANRNSDVFHHPECIWARRIKKNHQIVFSSVAEAYDMKYKPCKVCSAGIQDVEAAAEAAGLETQA